MIVLEQEGHLILNSQMVDVMYFPTKTQITGMRDHSLTFLSLFFENTFSFFCVESDTFRNHIVTLEASHMKRCLITNHEDAFVDLLGPYSEWM